MVKIGLIQTASYSNNQEAIRRVAKLLESLGKKNADIVCLPEQWLKDNIVSDFDLQFGAFKKLAKEYSMTIVAGAFYQKRSQNYVICAPVIGPSGDIIGTQEKIHPFDYEKKLIKAGTKTRVFKTSCRFGVIVCYDMVFADVAKSFVKKGAQIILSPSRIVRRGIAPWHLYVQVRALENRIPIAAANVQNWRFGGQSIIVDLYEKDKVVLPKIAAKLKGQSTALKQFNLKKYYTARKVRFSDARRFS